MATEGTPVREVRTPVAGTALTTWGVVGSDLTAQSWDAAKAIDEAYYANIFVYAAARALAEDVAAMAFRAGADLSKPTEYRLDSPLARLLGPAPGGPNPHMTSRQLWAWTIVQYLITGRLSWELAYATNAPRRDGKRVPGSVWPLPSSRVTPIASTKAGEYFSGYKFSGGGLAEKQLRLDQVFYHWKMSASDVRQAESALQAARLDVSVAVMQDRYDYAFLKNDSRPAAVVVHQAFAERAQRDEFRRDFEARHRGPLNAGKVAFMETDEEGALPKESLLIQQLGLSQRDSEAIARYERKLRNIIAAFGVPVSRLGDTSERTFSNADKEYEVYIRDRVIPLAEELQDAVNLRLAPMLGSDVGWFDLSRAKAAIRGARIRSLGIPELLKSRIIKINEARTELELDPVDGGDRFLTDQELGLLQGGAQALLVAQGATIPVALPQDPYEAPEQVEEPEEPEEPEDETEEVDVPTGSDPASGEDPPGGAEASRSRQTREADKHEVRRTQEYQRADRAVRAFERRFEEQFQALLDRQRRSVLQRLEGKRGRRMLARVAEGHEVRVTVEEIFDLQFWETATSDQFKELYAQITDEVLTVTGERLGLAFDLEARWVRDYVLGRANQLAYNTANTTYHAITSALDAGVAVGEGIPQLSKRIEGLFAQTYAKRAQTVARTEVISAYNGSVYTAGRNLPPGIVGAREWLSTPGPRTRATHVAAHGQVRTGDEKFQVGSAELKYPGDPGGGSAKEVVNCRCALTLLTPEEVRELGLDGLSDFSNGPGARVPDVTPSAKGVVPEGVPVALDGMRTRATADLQLLQSHFGPRFADLDDDLKEAIRGYQLGSDVNTALRAGEVTLDARRLDEALDALGTLPDDVVAYRAVGHAGLDELTAGGQYVDEGFMSAFIDPGGAASAVGDGDVVMQLVLPKGSRAAFYDGAAEGYEQELLVQRGVKWDVLADRLVDLGFGEQRVLVLRPT